MMKTRNHSFGLLNAQYRSVLKKCFFLNAMAAVCVSLSVNDAVAVDIDVPVSGNEWDNGNSYTVNDGDLLNIKGTYETANTLENPFIYQAPGGSIQIIGESSSYTSISGKILSSATMTPSTISGGFIKSESNISAASSSSNTSLVNTIIEEGGIKAETNGTAGTYIVQGGVIASVTADTVSKSDYFNVNGTNNVQINNNFINITDKSLADGSIIYAEGGALYNNSSMKIAGNASGGNYSSIINGNNIIIDSSSVNVEGERKAFGGAIYNEGKLEISGTKITENYAEADIAYGGAIYNNGTQLNSSLSIADSMMIGNYVKVGKEGYGGALYNQSKDGKVALISKTSFTYNSVFADNADMALGGAIYNGDGTSTISQITISSGDGNVYISHNTISAGENTISRGGAIYNATNGLFTADADGGTISFESNSAKEGGAVYNAASNITSGNVKSAFNIAAGTGTVSFTGNTAISGGAVYNARKGSLNITADTSDENSGITFTDNTATADGGAVYNGENASVDISASTAFTTNTATGNGGAIYNGKNGKVYISLDTSAILSFNSNKANSGGALYNDGGAVSIINSGAADLSFSGNKATADGGAIYNKNGTVTINSFGGNLTFENNTAQNGGAIYNGENGVVEIISGASNNVNFVSASDSIYNDGKISFIGASSTDAEGNEITTNMNLNGNVSGNGLLYVGDMVLNIANSQIDAAQQLNFSNTQVNLGTLSVLNVTADDNMSGANVNVAQGAIMNYIATAENPDGTVAGTLNNNGIFNAQDGVISNISMAKLSGDGGYIYLDGNSEKQIADVLNVTDSVSGTVNMKLSNMEDVNGLNTKILFAKTNAEQSTDDYAFKLDSDNSVFLPEIESQVNSGVRDWYLNYNGQVRREVLNDIILPRAMVEQTRDIRVDTSHNDNSPRIRYEYGYRNTLRKVDDKHKKISLWANPVYRYATMSTITDSTASIWGVDFGLNMNITSDSKTGLLVSYRKGSYDKDGSSGDFYSRRSGDVDISSTLVGLYYSKYFSRFYVNGMAYGGEQKARLTAHEDIETFSSTKALQAGAKLETGYEAPLTDKLTLTPLLSASYDYIKIDDSTDSLGKNVSYDDIHDVELEAGFKFDYKFNNDHQLPTNGYLKTTAVQLLESGGKVKVKQVEFDKTLQNETAGRIEIGGEAALLKNFVVGGFGNYTFGSDYSGFAVGGNVRYTW